MTRVIKGLGAFVALASLLAGLPALLWLLIGWPLPGEVPSADAVRLSLTQNGVSDNTLLDGITVVCWLLWLTFLVSFVMEAIALVQGRVVRRLAVVAPMQLLAAALISSIVVSESSSSRPTTAIPLMEYTVAVQSSELVTPPTAIPVIVDERSTPSALEPLCYTVVSRDTLWGIAERHLHDPKRWPELYELNKQRPQSDGRSLVDADRIYPGWVLHLPADAVGIETEAPVVVEESRPISPVEAPTSSDEQVQIPQTKSEVLHENVSVVDEDTVNEASIDHRDTTATLVSGAVVPASLVFGVGSALAALRLRRRHRRRIQSPEPGLNWSESLVDDHVKDVRHVDLERQLSSLTTNEDEPLLSPYTDWMNTTTPKGLAEARSITVEAISNAEFEVVVAGTELSVAILGDVDDIPGLSIANDVESAFIDLDAAIVSRTRMLREHEYEDVTTFRSAHPGEPVPSQLFVFPLVGENSERLELTTRNADRLDIRVIVVDHATTQVNELKAFTYLDLETATSLLGVIQAARAEYSEPVIESTPEPFEPVPISSETAVSVSVFGAVRIEVNGNEIKTGLRGKAKELLAFLALRPQGATWDVIATALWPSANGKQANQRFRTTLGNLRTTLRSESDIDAKFVDLIGDRYALDATHFDCDVWRFQSALHDATTDESNTMASLRAAVDSYKGELAEGSYYEWAEAPREDLRRRVLDALGRLAELHERDGNATAALAALEQAITIDPYVEELYQRVMQIQAGSGHPEAVVRTYRLLERRLSEIDVDPTEKTLALLRDLAA